MTRYDRHRWVQTLRLFDKAIEHGQLRKLFRCWIFFFIRCSYQNAFVIIKPKTDAVMSVFLRKLPVDGLDSDQGSKTAT